jgi:hypothetical protein
MVERPSYKTEKYESPAKLPGAHATPQGNGAAPESTASQSQASPLIHSIAETPRAAGETETIVKAANSLYRVLAEKIAYHEGEAKKLRAVFQGFASAAGSQKDEGVPPSVTQDDLTFLRKIADFLEKDRK